MQASRLDSCMCLEQSDKGGGPKAKGWPHLFTQVVGAGQVFALLGAAAAVAGAVILQLPAR